MGEKWGEFSGKIPEGEKLDVVAEYDDGVWDAGNAPTNDSSSYIWMEIVNDNIKFIGL